MSRNDYPGVSWAKKRRFVAQGKPPCSQESWRLFLFVRTAFRLGKSDERRMLLMPEGNVRWFIENNDFGFIEDGGGKDLLFISALSRPMDSDL